MRPRIVFAALASGALFGLGLAMAGMTDARRVLGFLDLFGAFDPTLLFVLGGAVATTVLLFGLVLRRDAPVFAEAFQLSDLRAVDRRLLGGAALFGIGWGLAGYCPGPRRRIDRGAVVHPRDGHRDGAAPCRRAKRGRAPALDRRCPVAFERRRVELRTFATHRAKDGSAQSFATDRG